MERKIVSIIVIIAIITSFFCCRDYMSIDNQVDFYYNNITDDIQNALLYDLSDDKVLFEKGIDECISVGSIIKVLTVCIGLQYFELEDTFLVGEEVDYYLTADASRSMIKSGQTISFEQLLYAILLPSGSDAAFTLAVNTARKISNNPTMPISESIEIFCNEMNNYAKRLGCTNSHFVNPDGQDDDEQYTCISDVLIIAKKALEYDIFRKIVSTSDIELKLNSGEVYNWHNTNSMIDPNSSYYFEDCAGIKTGFTTDAGFCLLSYSERDGKQLLCVVCRCNYESSRYTISSRLFEVGFFAESLKNYTTFN
ncbi:MAG: D-alanyl-D-alanine carboxypeptidase [Clostridia bacterium]|nr:D-alanyl-D-alanine carboxypeptidase [Clostridia bacterium]